MIAEKYQKKGKEMPKHITKPSVVEAAGNKPKIIREFIGRVNSDTNEISIAQMKSPAGWLEPSQTPAFDEYTFVLSGYIEINCKGRIYLVRANEVFVAGKGERVQYSTPEGAEYIAICLPAFSMDTVNRD